ncbi:actin depolymerizing protein [Aureobasidium pullulans]|uniref:Actin depolymerizing protein n=1 Tax=Aureobasidium pullulans TaxID=5580 RepID=A0A4S9MBI0_AURPU|nr:actin depolymerizing protein [Aureobasidium pullulans]THZ13129.1 actin depolymerizing protein [Aureobasidium pullulans]
MQYQKRANSSSIPPLPKNSHTKNEARSRLTKEQPQFIQPFTPGYTQFPSSPSRTSNRQLPPHPHYPYLPPISIEPLTMPQTADNLLSDPEIATAYEDVRSDKSATTWMVLKYISGTSDALKLDSTGEGEISEMVEHLGDDEAAYAFVRMTVGNDELSQRVKFVFVSWCGPNTRVMRRAKMTTQIGQVKQVLRSYAIEIQTDSKTDLKDSEVTMKLRKAMGANSRTMLILADDRQASGY